MASNSSIPRITWQEKLSEHCKLSHTQPPVFNLVSDRRGGRTAWSSTVTIQGTIYSARYFYAGEYVNNAKEDAAEVAYTLLSSPSRVSTTAAAMLQGQLYQSAPP